MMDLKDLKGLGPKTLEKLEKVGIKTLNDLILLEPKDYISYDLVSSYSKNLALIYVTNIKIAKITKTSKNSVMIVFVASFLGKIHRFIIFSKEYLVYSLTKNKNLYLYARYVEEKAYFLVTNVFLTKPKEIKTIYKLKDLADISITKLVYQAFKYFEAPKERLPEELVKKYKLLSYQEYLLLKHFPANKDDLQQVLRRKIYEKFFWRSFFYTCLAILNENKKNPKHFSLTKVNTFISNLPYTLTNDQLKVIDTILLELQSDKRINRLVEGDVGCGKTIVALISAYAALEAGYQVAFIAPTVILAVQHYKKALSLFGDRILLLTSNLTKKEKKILLDKISTNEPYLVIGTHSLLEDNVIFNNLGLVIIDEQQRFGVLQRSYLQKKYPHCDTLYVTATPIPRSLALTFYGALDLSLIQEKPQGRKRTKTLFVLEENIATILPYCQKKIADGEQMFIICPLIKEEEASELWDLTKAYDYFSSHLTANFGILHGQLKDKEKIDIINKFNNNEINVLLATTIVEVGIDVKNASILLLLDANRYGLSTIHQLRGRVGRGDLESTCFLINKSENERLHILEQVVDGFRLAEYDLKLRGPGELLSYNQSGFVSQEMTDLEKKIYKYASLDARDLARKVIGQNEYKGYEKILLEIASKEYENN